MSAKNVKGPAVVKSVYLMGVSMGPEPEGKGVEGTVVFGWSSNYGFGELTLTFAEGKWQLHTESMGKEFAKKVFDYIVENGLVKPD